MSRYLAALLLVLAHGLAAAATVKPVVPCGEQVYAFGGSTLLGGGVRAPGRTDFAARMETFLERACRGEIGFTNLAEESGRLVDVAAAIADRLARSPSSIAFIHFPFTDIEAGVPVDKLIEGYRTILAACAASGSTCVIGGQQPVNAFSQAVTDRQLELERRASAAFGPNYLPLYRYFQSASSVRRLMVPLDAGDGRFIDDFGHELLYKIYQRRLIELTGPRSKH